MQIFHYDRVTGKYLGQGQADRDPLDEQGWLIPANCTTIEPGNIPTNSEARWDGSSWIIEPKTDSDGPETVAPPTLEEAKTSASIEIDAKAEKQRLRWITSGSGQAMTYQRKAAEAAEVLAASGPVNPANYPFLSAEIGITGETLLDVATAVNAKQQAFALIGSVIEGVRLGAKKAVQSATSLPEIQSILDSLEWPEA